MGTGRCTDVQITILPAMQKFRTNACREDDEEKQEVLAKAKAEVEEPEPRLCSTINVDLRQCLDAVLAILSLRSTFGMRM